MFGMCVPSYVCVGASIIMNSVDNNADFVPRWYANGRNPNVDLNAFQHIASLVDVMDASIKHEKYIRQLIKVHLPPWIVSMEDSSECKHHSMAVPVNKTTVANFSNNLNELDKIVKAYVELLSNQIRDNPRYGFYRNNIPSPGFQPNSRYHYHGCTIIKHGPTDAHSGMTIVFFIKMAP